MVNYFHDFGIPRRNLIIMRQETFASFPFPMKVLLHAKERWFTLLYTMNCRILNHVLSFSYLRDHHQMVSLNKGSLP